MTFGKYLTAKQIMFIKENWSSLDSLEICFENGKKEVRLYEIKTKNEYNKKLSFKQKISEYSLSLYEYAKTIGFSVYFAEVFFKNDWNYDIKIIPFDVNFFCIDQPKPYDKK